MRITLFNFTCSNLIIILILFTSGFVPARANTNNCEKNGGYSYVCGLNSPEDLVSIPNSDWLVSSGFAGNVAIYAINTKTKALQHLYPSKESKAKQNMQTYRDCPGSPDTNNFTTHGLNIRQVSDNLFTLYAVGHGEREAIEVFEVNIHSNKPELVWIGCVLTPDGLEANSVASLEDGTLLVTIPLIGFTINDLFKGVPTGAVYRWSPGDKGFEVVEGTEIAYANGIETSEDGSEFYIASSGEIKIMAFSNTNPAKLLRSTGRLSFVPDNIRWGKSGKLVTAGMKIDDENCGHVKLNEQFDFMELASCPRSFMAIAIEPKTMKITTLASSNAQQQFTNVTMVLELEDELWFGSFSGDRVAYQKITNSE
ncbi:SMP-30/gluconolactonase/LRE family protein [Aliiglaciecola lipolytica]|uniref:SMP-30/Gluconolactonase/LRE-like region domain-containing protein n=1 Tax=Aliiglaciecola lipolytica E3 TaxID=1127673 RepID=K6YP33_9ALTE|nr:SMP-30/gluconolactonase/LRE family protein [Aliiglaciecola lipolytica]GAC13105.1 hypothetical protein GLIP_0459 [Aliiglaciecola lipolytica E3]